MIERSAIFSDCMAYRYQLDVRWHVGRLMTWIMLNPSTATEMENDPTIERCCRRAKALNYSGVRILNIFAFRATDPSDMKAQLDPQGEKNNCTIGNALNDIGIGGAIYCGWGSHGEHMKRNVEVLEMIKLYGVRPHCLDLTKSGQPVHPLYQSYDKNFREFTTD